MSDIVVREMEEEDTEKVYIIEESSFTRPWSKKALGESAKRDDTVFVVAQRCGETVGYACAYVSFDEAELVRIATDLKNRRLGIGVALLSGVEERAAAKGALSVVLEVRKSNEAAIGLYQKYGYENLGIRKNFYDFPKEDAVIMRKERRC